MTNSDLQSECDREYQAGRDRKRESVRATNSKKFLNVFNRKHFNATAASKKAGTMTSSKSMVFGSEWL